MKKSFYLGSVVAIAMAGPAWGQTVPAGEGVAIQAAPPPAGVAQDQPAATVPDAAETADQPALSGDVVVTARRRAESLQRVPVSIQAFGQEQLEVRGIRTESDLQIATPGLTARASVNDNMLNFSIRGQATELFSGISPAVLAYVNEVQISGNTSTSFFDLQSVQVLKGPQGTLFGRNTTGGAILYQTQKPTNAFEGYLLARAGNFGSYGMQGAINIPLVDNAVLLRVAGDYDKANGYIHNSLFDNYTGARDARALRVSLTVKPTGGLSNEFVWAHGRYGGTNAANVLWSVNPCGSTNNGFTLVSFNDCRFRPGNPTFNAFIAANPGLFPGGLTAALNVSRSLGKFESFSGIRDPFHRAASDVFTNTLAYDVIPGLTIKNITGYARTNSTELFDNDASPYVIFSSEPDGQRRRGTQFSNEFQLSGTVADGRLNYIAGLFYSKQSNFTNVPILVPGPTLAPVLVPFTFNDSDQSKAVFGQVSYKLTDKLTVTAGGRYTWELLKKTDEPGTLWFTLFGGPNPQRVTFSKPSWTFGLDYQATPELMVYAATRGSWRTGGFNPFTPPITAPPSQGGNLFAPETTYDIELGAKFAGHADPAQHRVLQPVGEKGATFGLLRPERPVVPDRQHSRSTGDRRRGGWQHRPVALARAGRTGGV